MANTPQPQLKFNQGCPDCGYRNIDLPEPLPALGDDFDWLVRDYDGFRLFMMEELLARFAERTRWTPADMEVVIVETLAVVLDQLSDMLDRVHAEAFLETARRPESVRRLLKMIGYDAVLQSGLIEQPDNPAAITAATQQLDLLWKKQPRLMELARQAGPRQIHTQKRMVTEADYAKQLDDHPLVLRAHAWSHWSGTWMTIRVATIGIGNRLLDTTLAPGSRETPEDIEAIQKQVDKFHRVHGLDAINWDNSPTIRTILRKYIDNYRMVGQEVWLQDAEPMGIHITLSVRVNENYFQSEIRQSVLQAMGTDIGGFFEPGRLIFGEDLHASDIFATVMALEGVEVVCLNRFKRVGKRYPDQSDAGTIVLNGLEIAVCDNDPQAPERGYLKVVLHGGLKG
jgi:hypothetical protein